MDMGHHLPEGRYRYVLSQLFFRVVTTELTLKSAAADDSAQI